MRGISIYSANGKEGTATHRKWHLSRIWWRRGRSESREGCGVLAPLLHQPPLTSGPLHIILLCLENCSHHSSSVQSFRSQFLCHFLGKPDFLSQIFSLMSAHSSCASPEQLSQLHSHTMCMVIWVSVFPTRQRWVFGSSLFLDERHTCRMN